MNVRRVLILSITTLAAGAAGYALLGLRAPKQAPPTQTLPVQQRADAGTIIAVGPDGTLYAIQAPSASGFGGDGPSYGGAYGERESRGEFEHGYEHE
jgi:hypothetical protein